MNLDLSENPKSKSFSSTQLEKVRLAMCACIHKHTHPQTGEVLPTREGW